MEGVWGRMHIIYICVWLSPFAVHLKLPQHCLLIGYLPIQNKKFKKKKKRSSNKKNGWARAAFTLGCFSGLVRTAGFTWIPALISSHPRLWPAPQEELFSGVLFTPGASWWAFLFPIFFLFTQNLQTSRTSNWLWERLSMFSRKVEASKGKWPPSAWGQQRYLEARSHLSALLGNLIMNVRVFSLTVN